MSQEQNKKPRRIKAPAAVETGANALRSPHSAGIYETDCSKTEAAVGLNLFKLPATVKTPYKKDNGIEVTFAGNVMSVTDYGDFVVAVHKDTFNTLIALSKDFGLPEEHKSPLTVDDVNNHVVRCKADGKSRAEYGWDQYVGKNVIVKGLRSKYAFVPKNGTEEMVGWSVRATSFQQWA
jgi:hypothetical protein